MQAIAGFLSAANLSPAGPAGGSGLVVRATPLMGMIKATDGPDWAVVCVDFEVDATLKASGQVAVADCQRMAWDAGEGRWMVGPGAGAGAGTVDLAGHRRRDRRRLEGPCAMASLLALAHTPPSPRWPRDVTRR